MITSAFFLFFLFIFSDIDYVRWGKSNSENESRVVIQSEIASLEDSSDCAAQQNPIDEDGSPKKTASSKESSPRSPEELNRRPSKDSCESEEWEVLDGSFDEESERNLIIYSNACNMCFLSPFLHYVFVLQKSGGRRDQKAPSVTP